MICLGRANNGFPSPLLTGRIISSLSTSEANHFSRHLGSDRRCGGYFLFACDFGFSVVSGVSFLG